MKQLRLGLGKYYGEIAIILREPSLTPLKNKEGKISEIKCSHLPLNKAV